MSNEISVTKSNGNVFADLGVADPEQMLAKAELADKIIEIITKRELTQTQAAKVLGIDQSKISALARGRLDGFSTDRLLRFLSALGRDVEIVIKKPRRSSKAPGHITVVSA